MCFVISRLADIHRLPPRELGSLRTGIDNGRSCLNLGFSPGLERTSGTVQILLNSMLRKDREIGRMTSVPLPRTINLLPEKHYYLCNPMREMHLTHIDTQFLMYRRTLVCFVKGLRCRAHGYFATRQQTHKPSQILPGRLVQCRVRPNEVADH